MTYFLDPRASSHFWEKCTPEPNTGCWLWHAAIDRGGYGKFIDHGRNRGAHRVAYETLVGSVPNGLELDHRCRTRCCVNPDHLEPVTRLENVRRGAIGMGTANNHHRNKTNCPNGHPYDIFRTTSRGGPMRECRRCKNEQHCIQATYVT